MLKIAICDDCIEHQNWVKEQLTSSPVLKIPVEIHLFLSGKELVESEILNEFQLIYLDIVMDEMDGIATLFVLKNLDCYVIFMSNTSDRLRELFHKNVLGFLDKPLNELDFNDKLDIFYQIYEKELKKVFVVIQKGIPINIPERDILYFENIGHYIHLHTTTEVIKFKDKISLVWSKLVDSFEFAMPNRSFIVNLKFCALSTKNTITVEYQNINTEVSIGRTRKEDCLQRLIAYAGKVGER